VPRRWRSPRARRKASKIPHGRIRPGAWFARMCRVAHSLVDGSTDSRVGVLAALRERGRWACVHWWL
jgi:hypothetical protein